MLSNLQSSDAEQILCRLEEIPVGSSRGFSAESTAYYADILVVRTKEGVFAYRNRCPHTGAPMEWQPDQFLDFTETLIQCGLHGAQFRIHDGFCISGPCQSRSLETINITVRDGVLIALDELEDPDA
ncbi:MAG: Rieske (2Fe-2S) protein [Candidatus Competibacteraceae bacterium]|jgi:nitrite reductase/ring-hydroxylating ferredoxin subunit|nr:Rieske (2Fe-2S) protein [Candidatus Competibacteraceae bacterium]